MPQFQPDRALEIVAPKYGTAYRIGGRLLLTCRHLFDNSNNCKVRFRSASNYSDKQDIDAQVIWKAPDNIDIALVELPETIETCDPVGFGLLPDASSTQKVKFDFLGFPLFLRYVEDEIKYATGLHIEGTIDVSNRAPHNRLLLNIKDSKEIQPTDEQLERLAEDQSPWQGTSGSAIVCYGLVIGVQSKQPIRDRPASLEAESLARVYDNPEWCEILENHDIDPEPKPVISASLKSSSYRNQAPPKPSYFVERPEVSIELKKLLLSEITEKTGTLVISAIYGLGGIGKSTLAAALAQEKEVQAFFPDGIFWATLGQQPDILSFLHGWIQALGDYNFKPTGIDAASLHLRTLLADKKALLVVDDLWNVEDIDPFRVAVNQCKLLVTTREVPVKGAIRYDLDVMTESQSLALLTGYLKHELNLLDQKQAKILAKIVGYLPLALELTAAQIEDGIPWAELIEDLRAEIAHLEILDRLEAGDTANEEKRKHYSLIASFNLSLKRLNGQGLRQFSWLGVLPDDVTITEKMAATLWDCPVKEARQTLRYLRSKALLLTGVSSELLTSYRIHDLLHDLARNLILASPHPETDYQLPGLGLSMAEAHQQLLQQYQKQIKRLQSLQSQIPDLTRKVFRISKDFLIDLAYYLTNVWLPILVLLLCLSIALHQLLLHFPLSFFLCILFFFFYLMIFEFIKKNKRNKSLMRQFKEVKAPLFKGINELKVPITKRDLGGSNWHTLADDGYIYNQLLWHLEKAGQIAQIHLLLREETADGHNGWYSQCEREGKTAIFIKDVSRAWQLAEEHFIENPTKSIGLQVRYALIITSLNSLAGNIPAELMASLIQHQIWTPAQGLAYVRQNQDAEKQAEGLKAISPYLTSTLLPEALEVARGIRNEIYRAGALTRLADHLPESLLPEALEVARGIGNEMYRAGALIWLASHLLEVLPEALEIAKGIGDEMYRAAALKRLASHLPVSLLPEALEIAKGIGDEMYRAAALKRLASHLPVSLLPEALEIARGIENESYRAWALIGLAPYLPEVLPEALEVARGIGDEYHRAEVLTRLASHLPVSLLPEAIEIVGAIGNEYHRAEVLTGLASHLPVSLLPEALEIARGISFRSEYYRAWALIGLAPYLPEVLPEALEVARGIGDEYHRAEVLTGLAPHLPESLLPEALEVARGIGDEYHRARALTGLAPHLPESLLTEALEIPKGDLRRNNIPARQTLCRRIRQALSSTLSKRIQESRIDSFLLTRLAPHLPESLLPEAIEIARGIGDEYHRARALTQLAHAQHLPKSLLTEALEIAKEIKSEHLRAEALNQLASHLRVSLLREALTEKSLLPEALEVARAIGDESSCEKALYKLKNERAIRIAILVTLPLMFIGFAPLIFLLEKCPILASFIGYIFCIYTILSLILYFPSSPLISKPFILFFLFLFISGFIENDKRNKNLTRQFKNVRTIESETVRVTELTDLVPDLPKSLLLEALEIARGIKDRENRDKALTALACRLPEVLPEALAAVREIEDGENRAKALTALARYLPKSLLPEALEIARGISFRSEYYRAEALIKLAPYLHEVLPEALEAAKEIEDKYYREELLKSLTKGLTPDYVDLSFWQDILHALGTLARSNFLETIPNLVPLILHFGGEVALREVYQGIREVSRWWK